MSALIQLVPQHPLPQMKGQGLKLTTHMPVGPRVRTHGAVPDSHAYVHRVLLNEVRGVTLFVHMISYKPLVLDVQVRCNFIFHFHLCLTVHLLNFLWCTDHPDWRFL